MPVYVQCSESQGERGPPSAVRAVLPELRAEHSTHASCTATMQVTLVGTEAWSFAQSLGVRGRPSARGSTPRGHHLLHLLHRNRASVGKWNLARLNRHGTFTFSKNSNPR